MQLPALHAQRMAPKKSSGAGSSSADASSPADRSRPVMREWYETTKGGKQVKKMEWRTQLPQPTFMDSNVTVVEGARYERRPSYIARKLGKRTITDVEEQWPDEIGMDNWEEEEEVMPPERRVEDCGWQAGPILRDLPPFTGPTPGPADLSIDAKSTPRQIVLTQITNDWKLKCMKYAAAHAKARRLSHQGCLTTDTIEKSMRHYHRRLTPKLFDLWLACRLTAARLAPCVPMSALWDRNSRNFDVQVFAAMTYPQFCWCNRHFSFADPESAANKAKPGDDAYDSARKRRELTDDLSAAFTAAWNPHQHIGLDDAPRPTRHHEGKRIRHKAAVHTAKIVDSLNDCKTHYCIAFEETGWYRKQAGQPDPNTLPARLLRLTKPLCDSGEPGHPPGARSLLLLRLLIRAQAKTTRPTTTASPSTAGTATSRASSSCMRNGRSTPRG